MLLRVDLNVPTENGRVTDATRLERVGPTITELSDKGGKVILLAHFGRPKGRDAFSEVPHRLGASGSPILSAAAAALDCRLHSTFDAGDHQIFIGEVLELEMLEGHRPLVFHGGKYALLQEPPAAG